MHPVGPLNPRVYWLRRVIVVVAAVLVLIGIGYLVVQKTKKSGPTSGGSAAVVSGTPTPTLTGVLASPLSTSPPSTPSGGTTTPVGARSTATSPTKPPVTTPATTAPAKTTPAKTTAAKTTAAKTTPFTTGPAKATPAKTTPAKTTPAKTTPAKTTPAKTAPAQTTPAKTTPARTTPKPTSTAPSTDAQGRLLCPDAALKLVAAPGSPTFALGDQPVLGVSVTNAGAVTCTRDLSGGLQVFAVFTAAGARVWATSDCFPGIGTDIRTLQPGQTVQYNVSWSGTTSNPGCTAARVQAPAGQYQLRVKIGTLTATPANFTIS